MSKISKEIRLKVWNKYNKKCAYCGISLTYKEMKVDHINALYRGYTNNDLSKYGIKKGLNSIENYNPSCTSCNSSKNTFTLEKWRKELILRKQRICRDSSTFRILHRFNLVSFTEEPLFFYFEKINL